MRILVVHSPYLSGLASGENRVVEDELRLLDAGGHDVIPYIPDRSRRDRTTSVEEGLSAIWSREAAAEVRRLTREHRPDIVHCHNLFPTLSPAVLRAAAGAGAAVVVTLHNYRLLCLPATFQRQGELCELCVGHVPWRGVVYRCYRRSAAGSAALATSLTLHRALGTFGRVALYLAVSNFVRGKHLEGGLPRKRVVVKPNFAWPVPRRQGPGDYFLFLGRLSPEKGLDTLVAAWRGVPAPLVIVGDGPDAARLRREAPPNAELRGFVPPTEIPGILAGARALVLPSRSYEGSPRSVLEAYAAGVPVIGSALGVLPEMVENERSGLLVEPGDETALAGAARRLLDDRESERLGERALTLWRERYSPEQGLKGLEAAYRRALSLH
jgi:glycosyltransferase involved in cell wall biosynthesis